MQLEARWGPSDGGALRSYLESVRNPLRLVNENDMEPSRILREERLDRRLADRHGNQARRSAR